MGRVGQTMLPPKLPSCHRLLRNLRSARQSQERESIIPCPYKAYWLRRRASAATSVISRMSANEAVSW